MNSALPTSGFFRRLSRCLPIVLGLAVCLSAETALLPVAAADEPQPEFSEQQFEHFERKIRPLLVEHCYECHSGTSDKLQADLRVDHRQGLLDGGDSGAAILPGDADASLFVEAIRYESYEMPPQGKLPQEDIDLLVDWINDGAAWPDEPLPTAGDRREVFDLQQRRSEHWAWQPLQDADVPTTADTQWPAGSIDRFILSGLEAAELSPAPPVDRRGLIRRLHFDLIGLPPTPEEVEAFAADDSPAAVGRLVDSLLASPHFGERWARRWLDLVRYAESRGHEFDHDAINAFQYRDYVIRAFNEDVPYDRFVIEHIAGDLLDPPRRDPDLGFNESVLGTGFWHLGEWVHSPVDTRKDEADRFDNMIDVMSKTFLAMTVSCARCHDHKFDAISTADYYALSGFLQSSDFCQVRFETIEQEQRTAEQLAEVDQVFRERLGRELEKQVSFEFPEPADFSDDPTVLVDFGNLDEADYIQNGFVFGSAPRRPGDLYLEADYGESPQFRLRVAPHGTAAADDFWTGLQSVSEHDVEHRGRLEKIATAGRTLRSPTVLLSDGNVACRVRGAGHVIACVDSHRLIAGPLHGETVKTFDTGDAWHWISLNLSRYVGSQLHFEFVPEVDKSLEVALVTQGATEAWKKEYDVAAKERNRAAEQTEQQIAGLLDSATLAAESVADLLRQWYERRADLHRELPGRSQLAPAMIDGSGVDDRISIRGNPAAPGAEVPRRFLSAIDGEEPLPRKTRSGRLELAERIVSRDNPLTPRVIVNRVWHHLMGRGIVASTDDFGVLGTQPTHPELLDHLALQFVDNGQSLKQLIREIVLSQTYQMSGELDPATAERDPNNDLRHHRPPRRIDGESLRDSLLLLSDGLDRRMYGASVPIHLTSFMEGRGRPKVDGPLDGDGRRSIYIAVRRNFLSPMMLAFDTPAPFSTMGRRNVSNVPAQALILMNDPLVIQAAQQWAEHQAADAASAEKLNAVETIRRMYLAAFARPPTASEIEMVLEAFGDADSEVGRLDLSDLPHILINTKEFLFVR